MVLKKTDLSRAPRTPYEHQVTGIEKITQMPYLLLGDEMRLGKSAQVIHAAQVLFERGELDTVIVICPASVRGVWFDPELGEIAKHHWPGLPIFVQEFHQRTREWEASYDPTKPFLRWVVTNYEWIRYGLKRKSSGWVGPHLMPLLQATKKTKLVLDESSAVSNATSLQSRACAAIRAKCGRIVLLNGTPYGEDPEDVFGQAKIMDQGIFGMGFVGQFRARYALMGGHTVEVHGRQVAVEILGWRHAPRPGCCEIPPHISSPVHAPGPGLEEIRAKMAPYVLRRLKADCLDLPPKLDPVSLTAVLTPETWKVYKAMRDETVAWLDRQNVALSLQAGVGVMRLAQITSGFLGGIKDMEAVCPDCRGTGRAGGGTAPPAGGGAFPGLNLGSECASCNGDGTLPLAAPPREVGREKLDVLLGWIAQRLREEPEFRMLAWFRFRFELFRAVREMEARFPRVSIRSIHGGQKRDEREQGYKLMHPDVVYLGPAVLAGTLGTGSKGLNMAGAHEVIYASQDYMLENRQQSEDRPHGPGQTQPVSYHDIEAVGPQGQKTIDHVIMREQRTKRDLSTWTTSAWVKALTEE